MPTDETPAPTAYYEQLEPAVETVESLQEDAIATDALTPEARITARRALFQIKHSLQTARAQLPDADPDPNADPDTDIDPDADADLDSDTDADADPATEATPEADTWDDYDEAVRHLERRLTHLHRLTCANQPGDGQLTKSPARQVTLALKEVTALRTCLPGVDADSDFDIDLKHGGVVTTTPKPYDHVEGRDQGQGQWLEYQLERAFRRWGYSADTRQTAFGLEVDVAARRKDKQSEPTDWLVAECKDWDSGTITPVTIFRLCMVAFACRAMPVLCHTTELTTRAKQLARNFEVRVLELEDLERGELPAPKTAKPSPELFKYDPAWTARDNRGGPPLMFRREPGKHFSYVPGFEPVGRGCDYEPIEDGDDGDDTHPAAGH